MGWLACECASSRHGDREEVQRKRQSCRSAELPSYKARMQAVQETRRRSGKGEGKGKGVGWGGALPLNGQDNWATEVGMSGNPTWVDGLALMT